MNIFCKGFLSAILKRLGEFKSQHNYNNEESMNESL